MTEINFKDLPIPAYFTYKDIHYQKLSKAKVREFGTSIERIMRSNPVVTYWGQDINDIAGQFTQWKLK